MLTHSHTHVQVRSGLFVVPHARLVALLARVAPLETQQAMQPALEQAARTASSQQVGMRAPICVYMCVCTS